MAINLVFIFSLDCLDQNGNSIDWYKINLAQFKNLQFFLIKMNEGLQLSIFLEKFKMLNLLMIENTMLIMILILIIATRLPLL